MRTPFGAGERTCIGLLAAFAMLAAFAFTTADRADAEAFSVGCYQGHWARVNQHGNITSNPGANSRIPCTEPKPGWLYSGTGSGAIRWVPVGGRGPSPSVPSGGGLLGGGFSGGGFSGTGGGTSGGGTSRTGPSGAAADTDFLYEADENNRAVRAGDGQCYRQQRLNGQWRRSAAYGPSREACRQASWNAYYRSQGRPMVSPGSGPFESGWPPGATIWSSTLTVGAAGPEGASWGCSDAEQCDASLTDASFSYIGTEYSVESIVYDPATRTLTFTLDEDVPEELTLHVGDLELAVADAAAADEDDASSVSWGVDDDLEWTSEVEVSLRLIS